MSASTAHVSQMAPEPVATLQPAALLTEAALGHRLTEPEIVETHISWVLLTGEFAYKILKPVTLPFLDFSSLQARRQDCSRELALNRRWAPRLYLGVVPIFGSLSRPRLTGGGAVVDYAVKMRQFPRAARLDRVAADAGLDEQRIDELADVVAALHRDAPFPPPDPDYGSPARIAHDAQDNLDVLARWDGVLDVDALARVRAATHAGLERLAPVLRARLGGGFVRECHGDLHLENLALVDGRIVPFDGVEFEPAFRWIDVASDLAFLLMDLHSRDFGPLANRLLVRYLERSGDYDALAVLGFYVAYRAMVRAKVAAIQAMQAGEPAGARARQANALIALAAEFATEPRSPWLAITHGLSGSGKSRLAKELAMATGAITVRSDVERARLFADGPERYTPAATRTTYERLLGLARSTLRTGYSVIVDATFLRSEERARFRDLAAAIGCPFRMLSLSAPRAVLEQRVTDRAARGGDASQADIRVLAEQRAHVQPLSDEERRVTLELDTAAPLQSDSVAEWLRTSSADRSPT